MDDKLLQTLKEYGLNEKESRIYLVVLELGSAPASSIARRVGLKRVTGYVILQDMVRKGLLNQVDKKGVKTFSVVDPEQLLAQRKIKCSGFEQAIPAFAALADIWGNKPQIQYFEGFEGIKRMYDDQLESIEPLYSFLGAGVPNETLVSFLDKQHVPMRIERNISAYVLVPNIEGSKKYIEKDQGLLTETRTITHACFDLQTEIVLYGPGKVGISLFSDDEMSAIVVQSHKLYESLLGMFKTFRDIAPLLEKTYGVK